MTLSSSAEGRAPPALEILSEDGDRIFCKIWQIADDGERRPVFAVFSANPYPTPASTNRLTHEYALRDLLDSAWAVRPVRLEHDQGRTRLLLEFAPGEPLDRLVGVPIETATFLRLAIALSVAIGRL